MSEPFDNTGCPTKPSPKPAQEPEAKRIPIPKNVTDREFWLDCFASFAQTLIDQAADKQIGTVWNRAKLDDSVIVAAQLADTALEEALFRQWVAGTKKKRKQPTGRQRR
jgi:hypothetical protein